MGLKILEAWDGLLMGRVEEEVGVGVCVWVGGEGCDGIVFRRGTETLIQAAFPNGPQSGASGAHLGPNFAQLGPNRGPHGMLLGKGPWLVTASWTDGLVCTNDNCPCGGGGGGG